MTKNTETPTEKEPVATKRARETRVSKSRAGLTRGITGRLVDMAKVSVYDSLFNQSRISIPEEIRKRFASEGYHVGWIRYLDTSKSSEDNANLYKKIDKMGFELVRPEEVPEMVNGFRHAENEIYGTMITEGDLALAKIPSEDYEAIQEAKAQRVAKVSQGILNPLKGKGIDAKTRSFSTRGHRRTEEQEEDALNVLNESSDL